MLIKVVAFDHKNKTARVMIKMWQIKVSRWYSSNSKRTQIAVAPPSTVADIFLFLHKKTSAAATIRCIFNQSLNYVSITI